MKGPGMMVFGSTKPGHRHPEARAQRASKDERPHWCHSSFETALSRLLRMTTASVCRFN
jgi:hypothetical protein